MKRSRSRNPDDAFLESIKSHREGYDPFDNSPVAKLKQSMRSFLKFVLIGGSALGVAWYAASSNVVVRAIEDMADFSGSIKERSDRRTVNVNLTGNVPTTPSAPPAPPISQPKPLDDLDSYFNDLATRNNLTPDELKCIEDYKKFKALQALNSSLAAAQRAAVEKCLTQ